MVAAAALMSSCGPDEGTEQPAPEKEFYGFTMTGADVTSVGNDEYIIQSYILDEEGYTTRLLSAHATIPGVDLTAESPLLPEGTFALVEGEIGDNNAYIAGSYYENSIAETPYTVLITEGEVEIKYTANGYRLTFYADGVNAETGAAMNDIECRYEGDAEIYGNKMPSVADSAAAVYYGAYGEADYWLFQFDVTATHYMNLCFNTPVGNIADGIPTGKYPFTLTGAAGTADMSYYTEDGYTGSMVIYAPEGEQGRIYHLVAGGEVDLTNNGDGTYAMNIVYYNHFNIPYVMSYNGGAQVYDYSGPTEYTPNIEEAALLCVDGTVDWWYLYLIDSSFYNGYGLQLFFDISGAAGDNFEHGLSSGEYTFSENYDPMTLYPGMWVEEDGEVVGFEGCAAMTMPLDEAGNYSVYDVLYDGKLVVTNNGDGTYKFELNAGSEDVVWIATYEGTPTMEDYTQYEEAAAPAQVRAAKAPLKAAAKVVNVNKFDKDAAYELIPGRNRF